LPRRLLRPLNWSPSTDNVAVSGYDVYRFDGFFISTRLVTVTGSSYLAPVLAGSNQLSSGPGTRPATSPSPPTWSR